MLTSKFIRNAIFILGMAGVLFAQNTKKPVPLTPSARLGAAKTAYITTVSGSSIPYNVLTSALQGWGRLQLVNAPEQADIILEISAPDGGGGVSISSSNSAMPGRPEQTTSTSRQISNGPLRLIVYDAKSRMALWSANEQPKFAVKQQARENNLVEASQRLWAKFRERIEPTPAQ
jgi:hypothetical protein